MDYIVVMKNGSIVESGTYSDLMSKQGEFADFIANFSQEEQNKEHEVPEGNLGVESVLNVYAWVIYEFNFSSAK